MAWPTGAGLESARKGMDLTPSRPAADRGTAAYGEPSMCAGARAAPMAAIGKQIPRHLDLRSGALEEEEEEEEEEEDEEEEEEGEEEEEDEDEDEDEDEEEALWGGGAWPLPLSPRARGGRSLSS
ncbi:hypothetical protein CRUP_011498 [Coryphaenoides rupestris]|nr:hypothetical protein CRUP_011498 [Coryphaenoides rupestris]